MAKDSITFDFCRFHIPPWSASDFEVVYLPFPEGSGSIPHPLTDEHPFFSLPPEAFDETGENLICIREKRWMGNERIGTRPLPALAFTQELLRPEAFAHIELEDTSPESLCSLMDSSGLIVAPVFDSQKRFIDCRFHDRAEYGIAYEELYPLEIDDASDTYSENLLNLVQAAHDINSQYLIALGGSENYAQPFNQLCGGNLIEAVALSEYARRITCREVKGQTSGGIISYYEVLLVLRGIFAAMADLIGFSIADGKPERFAELAQERADKGNDRPISNFALDLFAANEGSDTERNNAFANLGSYVARDAFSFLQQCMMTTTGATWGQVVHASTSAKELYGDSVIKMPEFLEPQRNFYKKHEPNYLANRYCEGSFSAALAAQFLTSLADPAPWKRCDNPECGTYFKHFFSEKGRSNPKATSCSPVCSTRKRNRLYNIEASAIRTACKRYSSVNEAVAYVEKRLSSEIELKDLPKARRRWRKNVVKALRSLAEIKV